MRSPRLVTFALVALSGARAVAATVPPLPQTPRKPVTTVYHGVAVTEDYRWLEDASDPAVRRWSDAQNRRTRAVLDAIPARNAIAARLRALNAGRSVSYFGLRERAGHLFALKAQPPKQQPFLVALRSADDRRSERVVVDPNRYDPTGATAIDFYEPSLDGKLVAVCLSRNGSEDGFVRVFRTSDGRALFDVVPRVNYPTAGGSITWRSDNRSFYYTRYPQGAERPARDRNFFQQVFLHRLGQRARRDSYVIGRDFPRIAETALDTTDDGRYALATVANGDGGEYAHYLRGPDGRWKRVTRFADKVQAAALGPDGALYLLSHQGAGRGKVLRMPYSRPVLDGAEMVVPQGQNAITGMVPTRSRLYVLEVAGGPNRIRVGDLHGRRMREVPVPLVSAVYGALRDGDDGLLFHSTSFTQPGAWFRYDPRRASVRRTALYATSPARFGDTVVTRAFATSKDGTKVPMTLVMRKGTRRGGDNPTLLSGYGGYGVVESPYFDPSLRLWLDAGGIFVSANIRGGGEYGEDWHLAGNLTRKQNVFDDFAAVARYLVREKYTRPEKLAIEGGSNGGTLMGAMMNQHPGLFRAVVSHVGVYDALREELTPNGEFNTTEFGTVKDPAQFRAMAAYSPYHNVKDGVPYPAVLLTAGDNDGRVDPSNSRKFAARLQASGTKRPVLLRTSSTSGHGIGTSLDEGIAQSADVYAFLFWQLGMKAPR